MGLYQAAGGSSIQQYDDVRIGYDNNSDDDIADDGDDIQIDDGFSSNVISLSYDTEGDQGGSPKGNLTLDTPLAAQRRRSRRDRRAAPAVARQGQTDDAVYKYEYDAWNRLVEVKRRVDAETSVATYAYLGDNRRASKVVQNCGTEHLAGDGGNTTVEYYYDRRWRIVETRNGSNQATAQYVWGTQYVDEPIMVDVNGDVTESNDCDPDDQSGESTADERYFYHQDRNWNVVALSEYDTAGTNNGRIVERYSYTPYGQFVVLAGDSGNGEMGNLSRVSTVGNVFTFQGLAHEAESGQHNVRYRMYDGALGRFVQRDPAGYSGSGMNLYAFVGNRATLATDPSGLGCAFQGACGPGGTTGAGDWVGATGTECIGPDCPGDDDDKPPPPCDPSTCFEITPKKITDCKADVVKTQGQCPPKKHLAGAACGPIEELFKKAKKSKKPAKQNCTSPCFCDKSNKTTFSDQATITSTQSDTFYWRWKSLAGIKWPSKCKRTDPGAMRCTATFKITVTIKGSGRYAPCKAPSTQAASQPSK